MRRVVITGLGALTPIGNTVEAFKEGLFSGKTGANLITYFDTEKFKTKFACELKDFRVEDYIHRREARRMDPCSWYGVIAADQAMSDSGIDIEKIDSDRAGVIWGSGIGGLKTMEDEIKGVVQRNDTKYNPFLIPKMIIDITAGLISMKYNFRGINYATVSACASSSHAMINATDYIKLGKADIIMTGGSEAAVVETGIGGFSSMKALSVRNDDPGTASRPFDAERDGFVLGEGAAALILEEYEHAKARGAKIYAEVLGGAMTADAHHITAPHPEGLGAKKVMELALEYANLNKSDVDYINVHGTSTPLGDIAEVRAIQAVFGDAAYDLNISSTKSMTGHLLGAAGAVEAIACTFAVMDNLIPPTINHFNDDPAFDPKLNFTFNETQEREVRTALCNTFGFGGHNTSLIIKKM